MEVSLSKALVEAEREIEVLRERSKRVAKLEQANIELHNERDEWKRRAKELFMAAQNKSVDIPPEAAEWFKE